MASSVPPPIAPPASTASILISAHCGKFCVAVEDGEAIFALILDALQSGKAVRLSFAGVESLSTAFLNAAIGELLGVVSAEKLNACLEIEGLGEDDLAMLRRVIANAKRYYANPESFRALQNHMETA